MNFTFAWAFMKQKLIPTRDEAGASRHLPAQS